jgi:hypothetical protein
MNKPEAVAQLPLHLPLPRMAVPHYQILYLCGIQALVSIDLSMYSIATSVLVTLQLLCKSPHGADDKNDKLVLQLRINGFLHSVHLPIF